MALVGQAIQAVVLGTAAAASGYGLSLVLGKRERPVTLGELKEEDGKIKDANKLGGVPANADRLVANVEGNRRWWQGSYEEHFLRGMGLKKHLKFRAVNAGYSKEKNLTALNWACGNAYEEARSSFEGGAEGENSPALYRENVELFCGVGDQVKVELPSSS